LVDVRDESTDVVRVVLELRKPGDEAAAMGESRSIKFDLFIRQTERICTQPLPRFAG